MGNDLPKFGPDGLTIAFENGNKIIVNNKEVSFRSARAMVYDAYNYFVEAAEDYERQAINSDSDVCKSERDINELL